MWSTAAAVAVLVLTTVYYVALFAYTGNAIQREDVLRLDGPGIASPDLQQDAQNYLLVSADAGTDGTTMLAHLSADRSRAVVVSFPGDGYVDVPACPTADGGTSEPYTGRLSSAVATGGAACLVRSVQLLTGIRINHYVQVDVTGLPRMVGSLGGVPMCLNRPLLDAAGGLDLAAGTSVLTAEQALPFVRAGQDSADSADRIARQQDLLAAMLDKALSVGTVVNPIRVTAFLSATAATLTLDPDTTLGELKNLVQQLQDLGSQSAELLAAPVADPIYTPTGSPESYVLLDEDLGSQLYTSIIADAAAPEAVLTAARTPTSTAAAASTPTLTSVPPTTAAPSSEPGLTVPPDQITVDVVNGAGIRNLATRASTDLEGLGFRIGVLSIARSGAVDAVIRYAPDQREAARTLAAAVPGTTLEEDPGLGTTLQLVVGSGYAGVVPVTVAPPAPPAPPASTPAATTLSQTAPATTPARAPARVSCP